MYARKLTKEELLANGITKVTIDGHVYKGEEEVIPQVNGQGYFLHSIYDLDKDGNRIKIIRKKSAFGYVYKTRSIGLHRLMWAWHSKEEMVPDGMVIDHINNRHSNIEDYHLSNLQCITPAENLAKERQLTYIARMPRYITLEKIENKLAYYTDLYEQAKADHDADKTHKLRTSISQWKSKKRQYLENPEKYTKPVEEVSEHDCHARAAERKRLKLAVDEARRFYQEAREKLGKDDEVTQKFWGMWKLAIAEYQGFCDEIKKTRSAIS